MENIILTINFGSRWELTTLRQSLHNLLLTASEAPDAKLEPVYVNSIMRLLIWIDEKEYDLDN